MKSSRRKFLKHVGMTTAGVAVLPHLNLRAAEKTVKSNQETWFKISLAQWSLHRTLYNGDLDNLDFPEFAAKNFDIHAVEYVNQFFKDKAKDTSYLKELNKRAADNGVTNVLIMVDGEGNLGDADESKRVQAVENHYKWVDAAHFLGCKTIRVNAAGEGTPEEVGKRCIASLSQLSDYAIDAGINVVVENHGGISSHGDWLSNVLHSVGKLNCGSLPDFGNFYEYDRYKGVKELMIYAKGVSAKTNVFDDKGNEREIDYARLMDIVKAANYRGYVGIEFECSEVSEIEGIKLSKKLLERWF